MGGLGGQADRGRGHSHASGDGDGGRRGITQGIGDLDRVGHATGAARRVDAGAGPDGPAGNVGRDRPDIAGTAAAGGRQGGASFRRHGNSGGDDGEHILDGDRQDRRRAAASIGGSHDIAGHRGHRCRSSADNASIRVQTEASRKSGCHGIGRNRSSAAGRSIGRDGQTFDVGGVQVGVGKVGRSRDPGNGCASPARGTTASNHRHQRKDQTEAQSGGEQEPEGMLECRLVGLLHGKPRLNEWLEDGNQTREIWNDR